MKHYKLLVCTNSRFSPKSKSCGGLGSEALLDELKALAKGEYIIEEIKCFGQCEKGPVMRIAPALDFFYHVTSSDLPGILESIPKDE